MPTSVGTTLCGLGWVGAGDLSRTGAGKAPRWGGKVAPIAGAMNGAPIGVVGACCRRYGVCRTSQ